MTDMTVETPDVDKELFGKLLRSKRELDDREVATMLNRIQPVVHHDGEWRFIEPVDPRRVSFLWSPSYRETATCLEEVERIFTLHTWGYYGLFKPSIAEVLSMIPSEMSEKVKAFATFGPRDVQDLNRQWCAVDEGYHVAVTILFA